MMGLEVTLEDVFEAQADQPAAVSTRSLSASPEADSSRENWATAFRVAGFTLLAGGASLLPFLWNPRRRKSQAIDDLMARQLDWLDGCISCGLALR